MNSQVVPEYRERRRWVDGYTLLGFVVLLLLVGGILWGLFALNWNTWGEKASLVIGGTVTLLGGLKLAQKIHTHLLDTKKQKLQHKTQELHHTALLTAFAKNYTVEYQTFADGTFQARYTSPWTIPRTSVEELPVPQEQPLALPAPMTSEQLDISPDFRPHADTVLSGRVNIFGVSGSGKSNTFANFGEELGRLRVPLLIGDTEDEYESLADTNYLPNPQIVDASTITVVNAEEFGRYILDARLQAILNLASFPDDEAAQVLTNIIEGMWQWEEERRIEQRISCMVMLDEASKWLPQNTAESTLSDTIQKAVSACFSRAIVSRGRKRGIGCILANQRIATLNKNVLQPNVQILHSQTQDVDIKRYAAMGISYEEVASLQQGEAFIFSPHVAKLRTRVNRRRSPHGAHTPGLASLRHGNDPETFSVHPRVSERDFGSFDEPVTPVENISAFRQNPREKGIQDVPENIRNAIAARHRNGELRTHIQAALSLNDDQYWMVKVVCDREIQQRRS